MSDLIGTKRPSRARSLRAWVTVLVLLSMSLIVAYLLYRRVSSYVHPNGSAPSAELRVDPTAPEDGLHYGPAQLHYLGPLGILHTAGNIHDIGAQQGRLLASEISAVEPSLEACVEQSVSRDGLLGESLHNIRLRWRWRTLDNGIPGHQLVEMAGLVRGADKSGQDLSYEDHVRQSAALDVGAPASGTSGAELRTIARGLTLLVPVTSELGDQLMVARSMSLPGSGDGGAAIQAHPVLHISHPNDALATASLGWPGMMGVVSGVNAERIGVFVHFTKTSDVRLTREAQPSALLAKEVLESARTLEEAIKILKAATSLGTAVYVLVDGNERSWAIVEKSPSIVEVRRGAGAQAIVDTLEGNKFKDEPLNDRTRRTRPVLQRRLRAQELLKRRHASAQDVLALLRDDKAPGGATLALGHRGALDDLESVHAALFDVGGMVLWISEGSDASSVFRAIDLRHELRNQGKRPAPPLDLPSATDDQGARSAVRAARKLLVQARLAKRRGHMRRARELAATALSRTPALPEALLVAGQLAQADGDELSARALLQRFLETGGDDLRAVEQAEAWLGSP